MNMQPKFALCLLALVASTFTGCRTATPTSAKSNPWEHKLVASPLYQQVKKNYPHPGWIVESENKKEIFVAVGNRGPDRFDKWCEVKVVKATGEVFKYNYNDAVIPVWLPINSL